MSALRGDDDLLSIMEEMSSSTAKTTTAFSSSPKAAAAAITVKTTNNESKTRKKTSILKQTSYSPSILRIWNPAIPSSKTSSSTTDPITTIMSNPTVEIIRRRSFEKYKSRFIELIDFTFEFLQKEENVKMPPVNILERWHFSCKLEEDLLYNSSSSSRSKRQGQAETSKLNKNEEEMFEITSTRQYLAYLQTYSDKPDPILISPSSFLPTCPPPSNSSSSSSSSSAPRRTSKHEIPKDNPSSPPPITTSLSYKLLLSEILFQYKREIRKQNSSTNCIDQKVKELTTSNKTFNKRMVGLVYSLRRLTKEMEMEFSQEVQKAVSTEGVVSSSNLSRKKKKKKKVWNVPKMTITYQHQQEENSKNEYKKKRKLEKEVDHNEEQMVVSLTYNGLSLKINKVHYDKLYILFQRSHPPSPSSSLSVSPYYKQSFLSNLYSLLCRYDTLQGCGLQSSLSPTVFHLLWKRYECAFECFASPFNCFYDSYCSAFGSGEEEERDVDGAFGSVGSFFTYAGFEKGGVYQANPPFCSTFIQRMSTRMEQLLSPPQTTNKKKEKAPLMFIIFIPAWTETSAWQSLHNSPYCTKHVLLSQKDDVQYYCEGTQHRRKTSSRVRVSSFDTSVFFLQNEQGRDKWKIGKEDEILLKKAFAHDPDDEEKELNLEKEVDEKKKKKKKRSDKVGNEEEQHTLITTTKKEEILNVEQNKSQLVLKTQQMSKIQKKKHETIKESTATTIKKKKKKKQKLIQDEKKGGSDDKHRQMDILASLGV